MADDFSDLFELAADLTTAPAEAVRRVDKALQYTATEIKQDWQQGADRTGLEGYAASIDYEANYEPTVIEYEVGPNPAKRQGRLGLVEEGGGSVRSAPQNAGRDALRASEADFERGLEIALYDATEKAVGG